ncbi:Acyl-CoA dehydrogenase [Streptomyces sp. 1222.5]|uniref:acyl-CoA dehydrogenase family protein n=1 Tax=unclassified Streptomyces TaxID=2593676 RepID=UPI0008976037|nr:MULTISPECIES: acyl-CoA dehydrogenase family protein [unclassified Streptomyces]PKW07184.1 alkylation response protein AidB-like acyl-CoA dehydrogenase [Streptomyces sp. 5112.2]SEC95708.1 Acyl-CoA dehydrogenase [Streptomyces sp. 1222.5]
MRFLLDTEQRAFADSLRALLTATDTASAVREWSRGERAGGRALWRRFADAGVFGLAVPEARGGWGPRPVEVAVACVESGRHALPGPLAETVGAAVLLASLDDPAPAGRFLPGLLSGESMATLAPAGSYALDAEAAAVRLAVHGAGGAARPPAGRGTGLAEVRLAPAPAGSRPSLDPARRLSLLPSGGEVLASGPGVRPAVEHALTWSRLATAAQALGTGLALLDRTVAHVRRRTQFGVPIGSFQAVKHRLADAMIALEFARPLLFGAATTLRPADVAAAKLKACEAAYGTARAALQLHGAIGYTAEDDLSLLLTRARALRSAWGTPEECRDAVLEDAAGAASGLPGR